MGDFDDKANFPGNHWYYDDDGIIFVETDADDIQEVHDNLEDAKRPICGTPNCHARFDGAWWNDAWMNGNCVRCNRPWALARRHTLTVVVEQIQRCAECDEIITKSDESCPDCEANDETNPDWKSERPQPHLIFEVSGVPQGEPIPLPENAEVAIAVSMSTVDGATFDLKLRDYVQRLDAEGEENHFRVLPPIQPKQSCRHWIKFGRTCSACPGGIAKKC